MDENPLKKLMFPRSVAFMGASNNIMRMGSFLLVNLIGGKFEGPIYPVHPKEETVPWVPWGQVFILHFTARIVSKDRR